MVLTIGWKVFTEILDKLQIASLHETGRKDLLKLIENFKERIISTEFEQAKKQRT